MTGPQPDPGLASVAVETSALAAALEVFVAGQAVVVLGRLVGATPAGTLPVIDEAWSGDVWDRRLTHLLAGRALRLGLIGAEQVLARWNPDRDGWSSDIAARWLLAAAGGRARAINRTTREQLLTALTSGPAGDWPERAAAALEARQHLVPSAAGRAIATEAVSFGGYDAARASGLATKTWVVTSAHPRASHAAIDGLAIPLDGVFPNGARWPGDAYAGPAETGGCTCHLTYGVAS